MYSYYDGQEGALSEIVRLRIMFCAGEIVYNPTEKVLECKSNVVFEKGVVVPPLAGPGLKR